MFNNYQKVFIPILSILLSLLLGAIVIQISGLNPLVAYKELLIGAFGSVNATINTLEKSVPLIFCGLAVAVALKGGLFNIGVEGQLYIGAFVYTLAAIYLKGVPLFLHIILCSTFAILAGAIWAFIAAILKVKAGAHEVVTTIMLNYIAILLTSYFVSGPFKAPGNNPQTVPIEGTSVISPIFSGGQLTWAYIIAIIFCILIACFFKYTTIGYDIIATGINPKAAEAGGAKPYASQIISMLISGGLAGLGGGLLVASTYGKFILNFSPGYGFDGIAIAVLGQSSSIGVFLSSILFSGLRTGGLAMDMFAGVPTEIISVLQGIMILTISAPLIFSFLFKQRRNS